MASLAAEPEPPGDSNDVRSLGRANTTPAPSVREGASSDEPPFVVSASMHAVHAFDVEEDPSPSSRPVPARTNCCRLMVDALFPFGLLTDDGYRRRRLQRHPCCPSRRAIAGFRSMAPVAPHVTSTFAVLLVGIFLVVTMIVYLMLTISSMTPFSEIGEDHRIHNKTKRPKVGKHWTFAICGKHLLQTFLIHYLCWQVLEPEPHVAKERVSDRELNKPEGVIHWCKRTIAWLLCQQYEEQWLSTFFIDHMLLVIVGLPYCFLQLMLAFVHVNMRESGIEMEGALKEDTQIFIAGIFSLYAGFNMVGFLCVTLGNGVRPRQGYAYVFQVLTLVLAVVMALEFLVQQQYRQRYSQFQFRDVIDNYGKMRLFMSASQLFATHGLFMLCAMHLGHAQHFERCPDLPWRKAATKALGCLLLMICIICAGYANRTGHSWPRCGSVRFAIAAWYECTAQASEVFVGLLLLSVGLRQTSERVELGATEWKLLPAMMAFFDFDSFLILVTFTASIGFKLAETFNYFAEKMMISWSLSVASTASSVGLAVFTFACWRNPPLHGFPRFCLWIALLYTFHGFIDFQFFEDCEFTSSTPGCCDFPGLRDVVGEGKEAWQRCALDDRCDIAHTVPNRGNETFYCALPHHHGHGQAKDHAQPHHTAHLHQISFRSTLSKEKCDKLHQRWRAFPKDLKIAELSEEEESFSTAFIQLKTVGSAGNIEFHFAIIGILLKVILFVEHPNSVTILQQRRRHEQARLSRHAL